jgi:hypothetical protein
MTTETTEANRHRARRVMEHPRAIQDTHPHDPPFKHFALLSCPRVVLSMPTILEEAVGNNTVRWSGFGQPLMSLEAGGSHFRVVRSLFLAFIGGNFLETS